MKIPFLLLLILVTSLCQATEIKYPVSEIPDSLKQGMYAVIRESDQKFVIDGKNHSTFYLRRVITVLRKEGKSMAELYVLYDKMRSAEGMKASVYDADGKLIKKLKSNEILDVSAISGETLFADGRLKYADLTQVIYPYTVEYEYAVDMKFLYDAPDFNLTEDDEVSIQASTYTVVYPLGMKPRYKLIKIPEPKVITPESKQEALVWTFKNIKPHKAEQFSPDNSQPSVMISPNDFVFGGYAGSLSSWESYGQWLALLNKDRDVLPEATLQKVNELTGKAKTTEEKAKILYEYMQSKTRYVSIQLGIGGLQPFESKVVEQKGYGDCKALSNYMVALLKAAGIKGYYATIRAGKNAVSVMTDFPSHQANHIVVAVPNAKDTIWLECTSQTNPFGYIGRFTAERKAMLVTETGGKLVSTPRYDAVQNAQLRSAVVVIQANGDATAKVKTTSHGLQYDDVLVDGHAEDQKKWLQNNIDIPSFDIVNFKIVNHKDRKPTASVEIDLSLKRYASVSGKRLFITPNLMNKSKFVPEKNDNRKSNIFIKNAYTDTDTIRYSLPEALYPEFTPAATKLKSSFGEYEASFTILNNTVTYVRRLRVNRGEYPKESYNELVNFFKNIAKADNTKMVFLSKT